MAQVQALRHAKQKQVQKVSTKTVVKPETVQSQVIEQQQSFEIIQTMLTVSFGSICYLRGLLPEACFQNRDYSSIRYNSYWPYEEFVNGNVPREVERAREGKAKEAADPTKHSWGKMMIVAKGTTATADRILSWLDGIFDALRRNYLAGFQISVILDEEKPMNVTESYVFNFSYKTGPLHVQPRLDGITFENSQNKNVTIENAKANLQIFSRCLNSLVQNLPSLPDKRFLTVHLSYTKNCPLDYDPPGFYPERSSSIMVPNSDLWKMTEAKAGAMGAGYYDTNLTIYHLAPSQPIEVDPDDDLIIPTSLHHIKEVSRMPLRSQASDNSYQDPIVPAFSSIAEATRKLSQLVGKASELPPPRDHTRNKSSDNSGKTYESKIREKLDRMLQSSSIPQDGVSTQHDTQVDGTPLPMTWDLKEPHKQRLVEKYCQVASGRDEGSKEKIACECGSARNEGTMLACDGCNYWKHKHCYGLEMSLLPEVFFCYYCLAETSGESPYVKLMQIAKQRRTLWIMRNKGIPSSLVALGRMLNCNEKQARTVVKELKSKGLLKVASGTDSQSQNLSLGQYSIDEDVFRTAMEPDGVFHHFAMISQFYVQVPIKATAQRRGSETQSEEANQSDTVAELNTLIDEHIDETQSMKSIDTTEGGTDELRAYSLADPGILNRFLKPGLSSTRQEQPVNQASSPHETRLNGSQRKRLRSEEQVTPRRSKRRALSTRSPIDCSWQE